MKTFTSWAKFIGLSFAVVLIIAVIAMPGIASAFFAYFKAWIAGGDKGKPARENLAADLEAAAKRATDAVAN